MSNPLMKQFQRFPDPFEDEPPLRVTSKDVGKRIDEHSNTPVLDKIISKANKGDTFADVASSIAQIQLD